METTPELYVGLMSGTSLDGIDAALIDFGAARPRLLHALCRPLPDDLRDELAALCHGCRDEIERMGRADRALGLLLAETVEMLLAESGVARQSIRAIGSHGQTIRHRPDGTLPFTLQIGDPTTIAHRTGITTVADFRRRDVAAGGQGAPLVPPFHRALFAGERPRAIVNIGGMANVTALGGNGQLLGFDTGPGNVLLDIWAQRHGRGSCDIDGQWAASGQVADALLRQLLDEPFFRLPPPKSTGRERFGPAWLDHQLLLSGAAVDPADLQATLAELTAASIADAVAALPFAVDEVYVCGGGACNRDLMQRLARRLQPRPLATTTALGIAPEWVEAAAFAWLAQQTLAGLPGNEPAVTGAERHCILGAIHRA
jgi:anhydro-N-acetylmuramic acid kinase